MFQRAVPLYSIVVCLLAGNISHVKRLAVRSSDDTVGLLQVIYHASQSLVIGTGIINAFAILLFVAAFPVRPFIIRVREIQTVHWTDPNVIWSVQQLAFIILRHDGYFFIGSDPPQFILFVGARPQISFPI